MMKTIATTLLIIGLFWSCIGKNKKVIRDNHSNADSTKSSYLYEPNISTLTGTIKEKDFWGPPYFGEDTTIDKKESFLILFLDSPIDIFGDSTDSYNNTKRNVAIIQLITYQDFSDLIGQHVTVTGTLFGAHTGHHHTEVLLSTKTILPDTDPMDKKDSVKMYTFPQPSILGDFDGDGLTEVLQSYLYSKRDKSLMNEYPEECEWGCIMEYDPILFLKSDNPHIPLLYPGELTPQQYGVAIMSNIGDVNDDGRDEVAIIVHYASMGGLNTCYIYGFCDKMWNQLFSFRISESKLFEGEKYCPNPTDISKHIFQRNNEYFYSVFVGDKSVTKKLHILSKCEIVEDQNIPQTGLSKTDFTGTWEIGDKGYYLSIEVKNDTVIFFNCSDGKQFPGGNYEWVADTLVIYKDNKVGDKFRSTFWLNNKTTMNCNEDGCIHRLSYKAAKKEDCGFY